MSDASHEHNLLHVSTLCLGYNQIKAVLPSLALISAVFAAIDSISIAPLCQISAHTINLEYFFSSYVYASKARF